MTDLLKIARVLTPDQRYSAYVQAKATPGNEQWQGALEAADPMVRMRHLNEHPTPGKLVAHKTPDASGRIITTYFGDARVWRNQFEVPGISCTMERPGR